MALTHPSQRWRRMGLPPSSDADLKAGATTKKRRRMHECTRRRFSRNSKQRNCLRAAFEGEVDAGLGFLVADGYGHVLRAVLLLPGLDGVSPRRKILQLELSVLVRDRVEGIGHHRDVALHPRVNVALHGDGDFRPREGFVDG